MSRLFREKLLVTASSLLFPYIKAFSAPASCSNRELCMCRTLPLYFEVWIVSKETTLHFLNSGLVLAFPSDYFESQPGECSSAVLECNSSQENAMHCVQTGHFIFLGVSVTSLTPLAINQHICEGRCSVYPEWSHRSVTQRAAADLQPLMKENSCWIPDNF